MIRHLCSLSAIVLFLTISPSLVAQDFEMDPVSRDGQPWRIALYQGGPLRSYQDSLYFMMDSLIQMGWLPAIDIPRPEDPADTETLWRWAGKHAKNDYLWFRPDAFYSAEWDPEIRAENKKKILERLIKEDDIDLVIAMGTWAGQDLANYGHSTPTMVISVSDALAAGIVDSVEDSGFDHVHAFLNPERYLLQVRLFHAIIGFQRLGVVYEDTLEGRSYAAVDKILEVATRRGFEVISCRAAFSRVTDVEATANVLACHEHLAPRVDAMYITVHRGVTVDSIRVLLEPLLAYRIPTFTQSSSSFVNRGVLFSISRANWRFESEFYAHTLAKILNGAMPRSIPQVFEAPPKIAINLATAALIGYEPPIEVLGLADEIYMEIEGRKEDLALR